MRLEHHQQPPRKFVQGFKARRDLVGVMGEVVDHRDAARLADEIEAALDALKFIEGRRRLFQ